MEVLVPALKPFRIGKTYVILPAYNEAASLSALIPAITRHLSAAKRPFTVLAVNDGSSDKTSQIVSTLEMPETLRELRHDRNRGYGAALRTGFHWTAEHADEEDAVITLDADTTHDPVYIPVLLQKLEEGYQVVTASYTMAGGHATGVPFARRVMSSFLNRIFRWTVPLSGVSTYTNGFRAYRASAVQAVYQKYGSSLIEETGFPGGAEFFLKIAGLGGPLAEIPFDLHYEKRGTDSKIHLAATIRRYLKLLFKGARYARS